MNGIYSEGRLDWFVDLGSDRYWMLLDSGYTPDLCTDEFVSDVSAFELTDGSYSRELFSGLATIEVACGLLATADAPVWTALAGATDVAWIVAYRDVGGVDATSRLMGVWGVDFNPTGSNYEPEVTANGLAFLTTGCTTTITPTS